MLPPYFFKVDIASDMKTDRFKVVRIIKSWRESANLA